MLLRHLSLPAILLLTACGGGSSSPTVDPTPATPDTPATIDDINDGFGQNLDQPTTPVTTDPNTPAAPIEDIEISLQDQTVIVTPKRRDATDGTDGRVDIAFSERVSQLEDLDFEITYEGIDLRATGSDDGTITVTLDGVERVLTPGNDGIYRASGDAGTFVDRRFKNSLDVETVLFNFSDSEFKREGFLAVGVESTLDDVNDQTGTAQYRGLLEVRINTGRTLEGNGTNGARGESLSGFGAGDLFVDFGSDTVRGDFTVTDVSDRTLEDRQTAAEGNAFPRLRVLLDESTIADGGFGGTANITLVDGEAFGNTEATVTDGAYSGGFFGDDAISAGGQVSGLIQNGDDTYTLQGAFATNR